VATPQPAPAPPRPAAASVGFVVQLGAFANDAEARRLQDRARSAGFSAFVEPVRTEGGTLHRVRVGPVADRADADALRARVAAALGVNGLVRPHP
jgi:cell division septation protein DedD